MTQNYVTGSQARMARAALRLSVRDVAAAANVSPNTVTRVEADLPVNTSTLLALRQAFEAAGVQFTADGFVGLARETSGPIVEV
ncbi:multiprotein-bridging factor 1 family protein [Methylobacterium sp. D53M]